MAIEIKDNVFKKNPSSNEVWGGDWTKEFNPEDLLPGTALLDPKTNSDYRLYDNDFISLNQRQPLVIPHEDYIDVTRELGGVESSITTYVAGVFPAHNEGTKFGSRNVFVVTPIIIDGDKFQGNEELLPYFLLEKELELGKALSLMHNRELNQEALEQVRQDAKKSVLETALHNGVLSNYLAFHDTLYPSNSQDQNTRSEAKRRKLAEADIIAEYSSPLSMISGAFRTLFGKGQSTEPYQELRGHQKNNKFQPLQLKQVIYQR